MNQNNDQKNRRGQDGGNWRGLTSLICWALLLTILVTYAGSWFSGAEGSSSVEITYTEFVNLIESDQVAKVEFDSGTGLAHITPVAGFTYTDENGKTYGPMPEEAKQDSAAGTDRKSVV